MELKNTLLHVPGAFYTLLLQSYRNHCYFHPQTFTSVSVEYLCNTHTNTYWWISHTHVCLSTYIVRVLLYRFVHLKSVFGDVLKIYWHYSINYCANISSYICVGVCVFISVGNGRIYTHSLIYPLLDGWFGLSYGPKIRY